MSVNWKDLRVAAVDLQEAPDRSFVDQPEAGRPLALLTDAQLQQQIADADQQIARIRASLHARASRYDASKIATSPCQVLPDDPGWFGRFMQGVGSAAFHVMTGFAVHRAEAQANRAEAQAIAAVVRLRDMLAAYDNARLELAADQQDKPKPKSVAT